MSDVAPADPRCSRCGTALDGAADGLCVRCLLTGALTPPPDEDLPGEQLESPATLLARKEFAGYELVEEIARGGMGIVFRARQKRPDRTVALKIIATGELASPATVQRFRTEAEAAARLEHPNIVPVYEVGQHGTWHFFSMRLIEGPTLAQAIGAPQSLRPGDSSAAREPQGLRRSDPRHAAALMIKIARAVHHAHQRGILHRDLKPNNILLDAQGEPHLTDFGLAKLMEGGTVLTRSDMVVGTPAYMSPEQAAGTARDVTVAVDVYGLGAVFYEMLTGRPPFEDANLPALLRMIIDKDPVAPSLVNGERRKSALIRAVQAVSTKRKSGINRAIAASAQANALFADLDVICLKCLEKDPARRYQSAGQFADDLERALRHESILAKPSTATQRVRKWVRRNPAKAGSIVAVVLALVAGTAISTWQAVRATRAQAAQRELRRAAEAQSYAADINLAQQTLALNNIGRARDLLLAYAPERGTLSGSNDGDVNEPQGLRRSDPRGWEWRYLMQQARSDADFEFTNVSRSITSLSVSADGRWLAVGQTDGGGLVVFDRQSRAVVLRVESKIQRVMTAFAPQGSLLAYSFATGASTAERQNAIRLWNPVTREIVREIPLTGRCDRLQFSADGQTLLTMLPEAPGQIALWRVSDGKPIASWPLIYESTYIHAAADLSFAVEGGWGGKLRRIDLRSGEVKWVAQAADERVTAVAVSPDQSIVASSAGFAETGIRLWDAKSGLELARLDGHAGYVQHLSFLPDSKTLISASSDQTLRLWNVAERRSVGTLRGHRQEVWSHALLPDQRTLISGAKDGSVLVWSIEQARRARGRIILPAPARGWTFKPDSQSILLGETGGVVSEWSGADFQQRKVLHDFGTNITRACFTDDGSRVAVEFPNRRAMVWDLREQRIVAEFAIPTGKPNLQGINTSGTRVYLDNFKAEDFYEWDVTKNEIAQTWRVPGPQYSDATHSADGHWHIGLNQDGGGVVRDLFTRTNRAFTVQVTQPDATALSPDGRLYAVTSLHGYVRLWEWPSLREAGTLHGFLQGVHSATFSADGKRLAAGSNGRQAVKLWDIATQRELVTLEGEGSIFSRIRFSPDGNMIGARNTAGIVHVWRAPSFAELTEAK